jgi:ribonuclease HIII
MDPRSRQLDSMLRSYWLETQRTQADAEPVLEEALGGVPGNSFVAARCLQLINLHRHSIPQQFAEKVELLELTTKELILRCRQVDRLGDIDTPPEVAIFDVLGTATDELAIEAFDANGLNRVRVGQPTRAAAARAMLEAFGLGNLGPAVSSALLKACDTLDERASRFQGQALFVDPNGNGFVLGLLVNANQDGDIKPVGAVDVLMARQANVALSAVPNLGGARWDVEWPLSFGGTSIGVGLYVAAMVALGEIRPDPLLAATGEIDANGRVIGVEGITSKLEAAAASGIQRVIVSQDNRDEASPVAKVHGIELVVVDRTQQIKNVLAQVSVRSRMGFEGLVRYVRSLINIYGLAVSTEDRREHYHRFVVADARTQASLDLYTSGRPVAGGSEGSSKARLRELIAERLKPLEAQARATETYRVASPDLRKSLRRELEDAGAQNQASNSQQEAWRVKLDLGQSQALVVQYNSGACVLSGQAPALDELRLVIERVLGHLGGLKKMPRTSNPIPNGAEQNNGLAHRENEPHIGTDEAGKGDFFGPLVSAAVYVDSATGASLRALGVRDSKTLSDKVVRSMAREIRRIARGRTAVTLIGPRKYNELYSQFRREGKNLNTLLAWGHARSIEDLLNAGLKPMFAVVDQFADSRYIEQKILGDTRQSGLAILQYPKAESDIAVAAASVLARNDFLEWMEETSAKLGMRLPKGASDQVILAAREIVAKRGQAALREYAKVSFRTMDKVLAT